MAEKYLISSDDSEVTLELEHDNEGVLVRAEGDESWRRAHLERVGDSGLFLLMLDNEPTELYVERRRGGAIITVGRHTFDYTVEPWRPSLMNRDRGKQAQQGQHRILAPMTGSIVDVLRSTGDAVTQGDVVLVVESMKMNNELRSPATGEVVALNVKPGDRVAAGAVLMVIQS